MVEGKRNLHTSGYSRFRFRNLLCGLKLKGKKMNDDIKANEHKMKKKPLKHLTATTYIQLPLFASFAMSNF